MQREIEREKGEEGREARKVFSLVCITYRNGKRMQVQKASSLVYIIIPLAC